MHLRGYQSYIVEQIIKKPYLSLMLDMGLGKTIITLTAINDLITDYLEISKVLVIAPKRVAETTWTDEAEKWEQLRGLKVVSVQGTAKQRISKLEERADVYCINRDNIQWLVGYLGVNWDFDMLVIDESSGFKNHQSKRFKALKSVRPLLKRIVELTGTPTPNGLMDLWSQIYLLDGGMRLGKTIGQYRELYFTPGYGSGYITYTWNPKPDAEQQIESAISDICISLKSEDYVKLPPIVYNDIKLHLTKPALKLYQKLEREYILSLNSSDIVANSAATLSGKLLQMANGACYVETDAAEKKAVEIHRAKIEALQDIAESNEHNGILVFYWFKHDLERLEKAFPKARRLDSAEDIRDWNSGKVHIMLAHPASAGHGLNLQYGGNVIVWFGLSWSLELYQQANKRLHRSGQTKPVIIHHLIAEGTIDEQVMKALSKKKITQDDILNAVKARVKAVRG